MVRRSTVAAVGLFTFVLFAPPTQAATAFQEGFENGLSAWQVTGPAVVDCAEGYLTGCALESYVAYYDEYMLYRTVDYARVGDAAVVSFLHKTNTFAGDWGPTIGLAVGYTGVDGGGNQVSVGTTFSSEIQISDYNGWTTTLGHTPVPGVYYLIRLVFNAAGTVDYQLLSADGAIQYTVNPPHDLGSPLDTIDYLQIRGGLYPFTDRTHHLDNVAVSGDIAPLGPPGVPQNLQARTVPNLADLEAGTPPGPGEVILEWDPPAFNGNRPILHYVVKRDGQYVWHGDALAFRDTGVPVGQHTYHVNAYNVRGDGPAASATAVVVLPALPLTG